MDPSAVEAAPQAVQNVMNLPQVAMLGALGALIAAFWGHIKGLIVSISRLFIISIEVGEESSKAMGVFLNNEAKRLTLGSRSYTGFNEYVNLTARRQAVVAESFDEGDTFYFLGKVPIMAVGGGTQRTLYIVRGTINPDDLAVRAVNFYNQLKLATQDAFARASGRHRRNRFRVYRKHGEGSIHARGKQPVASRGHGGDSPGTELAAEPSASELFEGTILGNYKLLGLDLNHLGGLAGEHPLLDVLVFPKEVDTLLEEIDLWLQAEDWFRARSIAWRMGCLFLGSAGTGKTTLVTGIAQKHDMPVFSFDIATMSNEEFESAFADAAAHTPSVALIEDIDRVFHGDTNIIGEMGGGLTVDSMLNTLAGARPADGVLTFITANQPEHVPAAIGQIEADGKASRPGRIDRILTLGPIERHCREACANRILDFMSTDERRAIVKAGEGDTAAQFTDRCCQLAYKAFKANPEIIRESKSSPILGPHVEDQGPAPDDVSWEAATPEPIDLTKS